MGRLARVGLALAWTTALVASGGCSHAPAPAEAPAVAADEPGEPARIHLDVDAATRAGIRSGPVVRAEGRAEVEAFGRVLDPLPLVELLQARAAARATATVARAESERVARLHREDLNASTRDLEAARAALDKATVDLRAATARLTLGWGAAADADDAVIDQIVAGRLALVRVDVPAGVVLAGAPATVTVVGPAGRRVARVVGRAPTIDPLLQGESWIALVDEDPPRPGALVTVLVPRAPAPAAGVAVPAPAIVWVDGHATVYAEPTPGEFERRTVALGPRHDDGWIVTEGLAPDERVVVAGAARLLSMELTSAAPRAD